jgi:gliding motility-associated lipoprotein GldB
MKKYGIQFLCFLLLFLVISCQDDQVKEEVNQIKVDLKLKRFDRAFAEASPADLPKLQNEYPFLFPTQFHDSIWIDKMKDTLQIEIQNEVAKKFPDFSPYKKDIEHFYKYLKYNFPKFSVPTVITLAEEVDYKNKVILAEDYLLISLDNYLGKDHRFYKGIYTYVAELQDPQYMLADIAEKYARKLNHYKYGRNFLSSMIYYGKMRYVMQKLLPFKDQHTHLHYTAEELDWAQRNEKQIWEYFVEKDLLYSPDQMLDERFINLAPYSKFYLEFDAESPPRLGQYIGLRIVEDFMEKNPNIKIEELLKLKEDNIFKQSAYKPKK